MSAKEQLQIPAAAQRDPRSLEVLRVWIAEQDQHIALAFGMWEDPADWGTLLADLARHIANAHAEQDRHVNTDDFLDRLREGFDHDLDGGGDEREPN
jgi:hypothetical protein